MFTEKKRGVVGNSVVIAETILTSRYYTLTYFSIDVQKPSKSISCALLLSIMSDIVAGFLLCMLNG